MPTKTKQSRFLKLVRPDNDLDQYLLEFRHLTLAEAQAELALRLKRAAHAAKRLRLPELTHRTGFSFEGQLAAARLLARTPRPVMLPDALRGYIRPGDDTYPHPAYLCNVGEEKPVEICKESISQLLAIESQYPVFRDLQWLLRCWDALVMGVWASKLFRVVLDSTTKGPLALLGGNSQLTDKTIDHWPAWDGPAWTMIELDQFSDADLGSAWKACHAAGFGVSECRERALNKLDNWFKKLSIAQLQSMKLSDKDIISVLSCSMWRGYQPNLNVKLRFSVENQCFELHYPMNEQSSQGCGKTQESIPPAVIGAFLAQITPPTKVDLTKIILSQLHSAIISLTSGMIER